MCRTGVVAAVIDKAEDPDTEVGYGRRKVRQWHSSRTRRELETFLARANYFSPADNAHVIKSQG